MKALFITALAIMIQLAQLNAQVATSQDVGRDAAAQSIGILTATTLYYSYMYMGAVVDGFGWAYEIEDVEEIVGEHIALIGRVQENFTHLLTTDFLNEEEKGFISEVNRCCDYLKQHASAIIAYAKDGSDTNREAFLASDEKAWKFMSELLGLN